MAVAILEGIDLVAIAVFLVLLALLYSIRYTLIPPIQVVAHAVRHVPFVGKIMRRVETACIEAMNGAIVHTERSIVYLFHGLVWSLRLFERATVALANGIETTFIHLRHSVMPSYVTARLRPLAREATRALHLSRTVEHRLHREVVRLERLVEHSSHLTALRVERAVSHSLHSVYSATDTRVRAVESAIATDVAHGIYSADRRAAAALDELHRMEATAVGSLERGIGEIDVTLRDLERGLGLAGLAGLVATIPTLVTAVRTIAEEAGLDSKSCRAKNKGICGVPTHQWEHLLALLALGATWNGYEGFLRELQTLARDGLGLIHTFVRG